MTKAAALLKRARENAHLTQTRLSELSGTAQSNIARAEAGHRHLKLDTLDKLLHATGHRLVLLPTTRLTVGDAAEDVRAALTTGNEDRAYRIVIQLADDLASEHGAERVALTVPPPTSTGQARYDAFIAGVVAHRLDEERLPLPAWLSSAPILDEPWCVDEWTDCDTAAAATPPRLRARNVIIGAYELASL